jgi:ectoine hydroxylase-related dioxygenase (phytanoyl-CoA dioxygenase family)
MKQKRFWLDDDDCLEKIERASVSTEVKEAARALCLDGVAVIRGAHSPTLCQQVILDYAHYVDTHRDYVRSNLTDFGREKRLVNFHLWSDAAAQVGANARLLAILDYVFDSQAAIYTSLTFKYGTQQPVHRDTPHFATWPRRMFAGVWTALEDVSPEAGPLFYHRGAHRVNIDPQSFMDEARRRLPTASQQDQLNVALDLYNGEVIRRSPSVSPAELLNVRIGDTIIWHPEAPHGGSPAANPNRTRWSIVFHCAPVDIQVHQHDRFFTHRGDAPPPDRYGYIAKLGRQFAVSGETAYM